MPHREYGARPGQVATSLFRHQYRLYRTRGGRYEVWLFDPATPDDWMIMGTTPFPFLLSKQDTVKDAMKEANDYEELLKGIHRESLRRKWNIPFRWKKLRR